MILILIVNPSLAPSTETSAQGFALAIERIKLYLQGILLVSKLSGDISSVAPERELVRIGGGRVGSSRLGLRVLFGRFLALVLQRRRLMGRGGQRRGG
jgi:hypothetical protein